jgi:hypothetical protein
MRPGPISACADRNSLRGGGAAPSLTVREPVQAELRSVDPLSMGRPNWRTIATAALIPVAVLAGVLRPDDYLPKHGGVYFFAFLFLLGAALGYRAALLVLLGVLAHFIWGQTQCVSHEDCVEGFVIIYLGPFLAIPAVVGASISLLARTVASRLAKPADQTR